MDPKRPVPRLGLGLGLVEEAPAPLCDMTLGESLGAGADAASALLLLLPCPATALLLAVALVLEEGALVGPGAVVAGVCEGALLEAPVLDVDGTGAELVVGEGRGTTGLLPGVVPGEDGGSGTSLCMQMSAAYVGRRSA